MSFRTVIIKNRGKLDLQTNYLVYRGEVEKRIYLSEISLLLIESTAVSITAALLVELIKQKIKVIFCDEKHIPNSQLIGYDGNYHSSKQIMLQTKWATLIKEEIWTKIMYQKINNQKKLLEKYDYDYSLLESYLKQLQHNDITNREGQAAKVYFNELFFNINRRVPSFYNSALNYGYSLLLSIFCRELNAMGCITQLGIKHCNEFNPYNLACDLMEPFRVIVDESVLTLKNDENFKRKLVEIFNIKIKISNKKLFLEEGISLYTQSVINALNNNDVTIIKFMEEYELSIYENYSNVRPSDNDD